MQRLADLLRFLTSAGTMLIVAGVVLRYFYVDTYTIKHNGMAPTLLAGEQVLVWRGAKADLADVMLCQHPSNLNELVVGRAVAFAGHEISTDRFGNIYVDNDRSNVERVNTVRFYDVTRSKQYTMQLNKIEFNKGNDHDFFVEDGTSFSLPTYDVNHGMYLLGDNRSDVYDDSREFGEVDPATCTGQVFMRLRPANANDDDIHHSYFEWIR